MPLLGAGAPTNQSSTSRGPCVITAEQARSIFVARRNIGARHLASRLAPEVGISSKAIRDIWSLRTWSHVTRPYWTQADHDKFERKHDKQQAQANCSKPSQSTPLEAALPTLAKLGQQTENKNARAFECAASMLDGASDASTAGREMHCFEAGHVPAHAGSQRALEKTARWEAGECQVGGDGPDSDWSEDAFACFEKAMSDFDGVLHELGSQPFAAGYDPIPKLVALECDIRSQDRRGRRDNC
jgi:hypothetical protein